MRYRPIRRLVRLARHLGGGVIDPAAATHVTASYNETTGDITVDWTVPKALPLPGYTTTNVEFDAGSSVGSTTAANSSAAHHSVTVFADWGAGVGLYGVSGQVVIKYNDDNGVHRSRGVGFNSPPQQGDALDNDLSDVIPGAGQLAIGSAFLTSSIPGAATYEVYGSLNAGAYGSIGVIASYTTPITGIAAGSWTVKLRGISSAGVHGLFTSVSSPAVIVAPANIPGMAPSLAIAMQRAAGLLWQNAGKTVPAIAGGDPVRVATCPFTGQDYTAPSDAARPVLTSLSGGINWSLLFDGVDDSMAAPALSATVVTVAAGVEIDNTLLMFRSACNWGEFGFFLTDGTNLEIGRQGVTDEAKYALSGNVSDGTFYTHTGIADTTSGTVTTLRLNGVQKATLTTGTSGGTVLNGLSLTLGKFMGQITSLLVVGQTVSAGNLTALESYVTATRP